ncbi:MAG: hypothetical protein GY805_05635 [Chloroflexi bacterium]|nr:hypothetical protein [Chloroflexota bacterium]
MERIQKRPFWFWFIIGLFTLLIGYSAYFASLAARNDSACLTDTQTQTTSNTDWVFATLL